MDEMDFHAMKRKELQALCKKHKITANLSNLEMANKLSELFKEKEKPKTEGRIKGHDGIASETESENLLVNRIVKKVRFSPEHELIEFTRSRETKRRSRRNSGFSGNSDTVELHIESVDSPGIVTGGSKPMKKKGTGMEKINEENSSNVDSLGRGMRLRGKKVLIQGVVKASERVRKRATGDNISDIRALVNVDDEKKLEEEVVDVPRRVTRSRGQNLAEASMKEGKKGGNVVKSNVLDMVSAENGENKEVMRRSSRKRGVVDEGKLDLDLGVDVNNKENGSGKVLDDNKIAAEKVAVEPRILLRRSKRKAEMVDGSMTVIDNAQKNENGEFWGLRKTFNSLVVKGSVVDAEGRGGQVEADGRLEVVLENKKPMKVEPRRSRRKSVMPSHEQMGNDDLKAKVEADGKLEIVLENQEPMKVEPRRSRRKSVMPSHEQMGNDDGEAKCKGRYALRNSVLLVETDVGVSKDNKKVPQLGGVLRRSRHHQLNFKPDSTNEAEVDSETAKQFSDSCLVDKKIPEVQKNTRRSKRNGSKYKSLEISSRLGIDNIIQPNNKSTKRKRLPISKEDVHIDDTGKLTASPTKASRIEESAPSHVISKVTDEIKPSSILKEPNLLEASSQEGLSASRESLSARMSVPEVAERTSSAVLSSKISSKNITSDMKLTPTKESHGMVQDSSIIDIAENAEMEPNNGTAVAEVDESATCRLEDIQEKHMDCKHNISDSVVEKLHSSPEVDVNELAEEDTRITDNNEVATQVFKRTEDSSFHNITDTKELPEGSNISENTGSAEANTTADPLIFGFQRDFKTDLEVTDAEEGKYILPCLDAVDRSSEVKSVFVEGNVDTVDPLCIKEIVLPIECHPDDVDPSGASNRSSEKINEDAATEVGETSTSESSEGQVDFTDSKNTLDLAGMTPQSTAYFNKDSAGIEVFHGTPAAGPTNMRSRSKGSGSGATVFDMSQIIENEDGPADTIKEKQVETFKINKPGDEISMDKTVRDEEHEISNLANEGSYKDTYEPAEHPQSPLIRTITTANTVQVKESQSSGSKTTGYPLSIFKTNSGNRENTPEAVEKSNTIADGNQLQTSITTVANDGKWGEEEANFVNVGIVNEATVAEGFGLQSEGEYQDISVVENQLENTKGSFTYEVSNVGEELSDVESSPKELEKELNNQCGTPEDSITSTAPNEASSPGTEILNLMTSMSKSVASSFVEKKQRKMDGDRGSEYKKATNESSIWAKTNQEVSGAGSFVGREESGLQLLFATPIKFEASCMAGEPSGSERRSQNVYCEGVFCTTPDKVVIQTNSRDKMNEEREKVFEKAINEGLVLATTDQEAFGTDSSTYEEENELQLLFATPIRIEASCKDEEIYGSERKSGNECCSEGVEQVQDPGNELINNLSFGHSELPDGEGINDEDINLPKDFEIMNLNTCAVPPVANCDAHEKWTEKASEQIKETSAISEANIFSLGHTFSKEKASDIAHESAEKNIMTASSLKKLGEFRCHDKLPDTNLFENLTHGDSYKDTHEPAGHPQSPLVRTITTTNTVQVKESQSSGSKTAGYPLSIFKTYSGIRENTPEAVEKSNTIAEVNQLQTSITTLANDGKWGEEEDNIVDVAIVNEALCAEEFGLRSEVEFQDISVIENEFENTKGSFTYEVSNVGEELSGVESSPKEPEKELNNHCGTPKDSINSMGPNEASSPGTEILNLMTSMSKSVASSFVEKKQHKMDGDRGSEYTKATNESSIWAKTNQEVSGVGSFVGREESGLQLLFATPIKFEASCKADETSGSERRSEIVSCEGGLCTTQEEVVTQTNSCDKMDEEREKVFEKAINDLVLATKDQEASGTDSSTDKEENELQLLFASPIKIESSCKDEETYGSQRKSENECCSEGVEQVREPGNELINNLSFGNSELPDGEGINDEDISLSKDVEIMNLNTSAVPPVANCDAREAFEEKWTEKACEQIKETISEADIFSLGHIFSKEKASDIDHESAEKIIMTTSSLRNLGEVRCHDKLPDTNLFENLTYGSESYVQSEGKIVQSIEVAVGLPDADIQKGSVPESSHDFTAYCEESNDLRESFIDAFVEPMNTEVAKVGSIDGEMNVVMGKGTITNPFSKTSDEDDGITEMKDISLMVDEADNPRSKPETNSEAEMNCVGYIYHKEADSLTSNNENWSLIKEIEGIVDTLQNADNIVQAAENGPTVLGAESDLFSSVEMHLLAENDDNLENIEGESSNFNLEGMKDVDGISTAIKDNQHVPVPEPHLREEEVVHFSNDILTISDKHDEVLKESDVTDTIREYMDSESSLSPGIDDSVVTLPFEVLTEVEEKKNESAALSKSQRDIDGLPHTDEDYDANVQTVSRDIDIEDRRGSALRQSWTAKKNARTILIHGTPSKALRMADMKENDPKNKISQVGDFTTVRPPKRRRALQDVQGK